MKKQLITGFTLSSAVALSALTGLVQASDNPFAASSLKSGYQLAQADDKSAEGKCGEGKCGEGKCGGRAEEKKPEGKCGEGKCGGEAEKKLEGKCGAEGKKQDGKCGEGKCGNKT